jgi:hypothetical protein
MADTGAPWNIPFAEPSDLVRDWPALSEDVADAVAAGLTAAGFTARAMITATNASWPVPTLKAPIVKVTVIGGGGGSGGTGVSGANGGSGGTSSFVATAINVSAAGGQGGFKSDSNTAGRAGQAGFAAANNATGGTESFGGGDVQTGTAGTGGNITVAYVNLTGISTANVTVGAGGSGRSVGGRGEVIVEYVAG